MSRFGSDPRSFFDAIYRETAPWDVGGPQTGMAALLSKYVPTGPILDVGCGSGDLAVSLAAQGFRVLGIDIAAGAIAQAWAKTAGQPPAVRQNLQFEVANALFPSQLGRRFGAVVDSGFYHLFNGEQCERYIDSLSATVVPGGRYYLLAFAVEFDIPNVPRGVSEQELRARFTIETGWRIEEIRSAEFLSRVAPPVPALSACITRF